MTTFLLKASPQQRHHAIRRGGSVRVDGTELPVRTVAPNELSVQLPGGVARLRAVAHGDAIHVHLNGRSCVLERVDPTRSSGAGGADGAGMAHAPMPGVVVSWLVQPGSAVARGEPLLVIESMKLQMTIEAGVDGVLDELPFAPGQTFQRGATLARVRSPETEGAGT